jgi:adenosylhomocysteine nucleosidase
MQGYPLAIVAALDDEIKSLRSHMDVDMKVHIRPSMIAIGKYDGRPLIILRSGIGKRNMESAVRYLIDNYHPEFCLHVGYCGGADPRFGPGDIIIADAVVDAGSEERIVSESAQVERAIRACREKGMKAKVGSLVMVDRAICSPHEKAYMGTKYGAVGIDMESFSFASVCKDERTPYLVVRAVLDPLDLHLMLFGDAMEESGDIDGFAFAGQLAKDPKRIFKIPRLQYCAIQARLSIGVFVDAWQGGAG